MKRGTAVSKSWLVDPLTEIGYDFVTPHSGMNLHLQCLCILRSYGAIHIVLLLLLLFCDTAVIAS